jgi:predicted nucleic acid-binding protein
MIVADTNIISYLLLPTTYSQQASLLYHQDSVWAAPVLWRSEFRNVLALYLRQHIITLPQALALQEEAEALMAEHEFTVNSVQVLGLTHTSSCSAYDCEFIVLAKQLNAKLVTQDKKILCEFSDIAMSLDDFLHNKPTQLNP